MASSVFGNRLRQARLLAGLSQKELGIKAGVDQFVASPRVNRYELGIHEPDHQTARRMADVLGVPAAFLYADNDVMAEIILLLGFVTDEARRGVLVELRALSGISSFEQPASD